MMSNINTIVKFIRSSLVQQPEFSIVTRLAKKKTLTTDSSLTAQDDAANKLIGNK